MQEKPTRLIFALKRPWSSWMFLPAAPRAWQLPMGGNKLAVNKKGGMGHTTQLALILVSIRWPEKSEQSLPNCVLWFTGFPSLWILEYRSCAMAKHVNEEALGQCALPNFDEKLKYLFRRSSGWITYLAKKVMVVWIIIQRHNNL